MMDFKKSSTNVSKASSISKAGSPLKLMQGQPKQLGPTKTGPKASILTMVSGGSYLDS